MRRILHSLQHTGRTCTSTTIRTRRKGNDLHRQCTAGLKVSDVCMLAIQLELILTVSPLADRGVSELIDAFP